MSAEIELAKFDLMNAKVTCERFGTATDVVFKYDGKELVAFSFSSEHTRINVYWTLSSEIYSAIDDNTKDSLLQSAKFTYGK